MSFVIALGIEDRIDDAPSLGDFSHPRADAAHARVFCRGVGLTGDLVGEVDPENQIVVDEEVVLPSENAASDGDSHGEKIGAQCFEDTIAQPAHVACVDHFVQGADTLEPKAVAAVAPRTTPTPVKISSTTRGWSAATRKLVAGQPEPRLRT